MLCAYGINPTTKIISKDGNQFQKFNQDMDTFTAHKLLTTLKELLSLMLFNQHVLNKSLP